MTLVIVSYWETEKSGSQDEGAIEKRRKDVEAALRWAAIKGIGWESSLARFRGASLTWLEGQVHDHVRREAETWGIETTTVAIGHPVMGAALLDMASINADDRDEKESQTK